MVGKTGEKSRNSTGTVSYQLKDGFHELFEFSSVGQTTVNKKGIILDLNPFFSRMLGMEREQVIGRRLEEFINESTRENLVRSLAAAYSSHSGVSFEMTLPGGTDLLVNCIVPVAARECLMIITDITHRRQNEEKFTGLMQKLRDLSAHIETGMEKERKRIAREIHDGLGSSLSGLKMELSILRRSFSQDPVAEKRIISMSQLIDSMVELVRKLATELRPEVLDELGLIATLRWFAHDFQSRTGIETGVNVFPKDFTLDPILSTVIFRIFQEIMTNISRHAKASRVTVFLRKQNHQIQMRVRDDGVGIREEEINSKRSFGIIGIQERVKLQKGQVRITGIPGKGTTILIEIPINTA